MLLKLWITIYNANATELLNTNLASQLCKMQTFLPLLSQTRKLLWSNKLIFFSEKSVLKQHLNNGCACCDYKPLTNDLDSKADFIFFALQIS